MELWNCQASLNVDAKELATAKDELETAEAIFKTNIEELGEELDTAKLALEKCQTELAESQTLKLYNARLQTDMATAKAALEDYQQENKAAKSTLKDYKRETCELSKIKL